MRRMWTFLFILSLFYVAVHSSSYVDPILDKKWVDSFTDSLLREVLGRMGDQEEPESGGAPPLFGDYEPSLVQQGKAFEARREPSIRDQEYLEHSSLFGNQYAGATDGLHRQKPDGSLISPLKNSGSLPAYCIPPNPCPMGYTAADGCLQLPHFENTASFSREYQANQKCMCDSEHMFDCPGSTRDNEIDALARTFENEDLADVALDRLIKTMEPLNPMLEGEKLPVVAKKAPVHPSKI